MSFFIWSFRIIIYSLAVYLSFTYIVPIGSFGIYLAGPVASLAIIGDLLISAKMRKTDLASEVSKRIVIADKVLGAENRRLEAKKANERLNRGSDNEIDQR
jgi:hypothetical protein